MARRRQGIVVASAIAVVALAASACSSSSAGSGSGISVVASTNVYGDIVDQVAGDQAGAKVKVTSLISDPSADPHSYEADTRNQLAISRADLTIENGGGYDDFVDRMRKSAGEHGTLINVVDLSGKKATAGADLNEHVWYDFPTVATLVARIATVLAEKDPSDAATYRANAAAFTTKIHALQTQEAQIKGTHGGDPVSITEPVPLYLLQACGLVNKTPAAFSKAIEAGTEVSPRVLQDTLDLYKNKQVKLLAYNEQTSGAETDRVLAAAKANSVAVVPVTETLPAGKSYLSWMQSNLAAVRSALG
jgi:zinc/manganese transport system substrate-binding protein